MPFFFFILLLIICVILAPITELKSYPWWLNEGTYAFYSISFIILGTTDGKHYRNFRGTYGWKCTELKDGKAVLIVTLNSSASLRYEEDIKPVNLSKKLIIIVDLVSNTVKIGEKTLFHVFWFPINVASNENISIGSWQGHDFVGEIHSSLMELSIPYGRIKGKDYWFVDITAKGLKRDNASIPSWLEGALCYDKDTGLTLCANFVDPILKEILDYEHGLSSEIFSYQLKSTNILEEPKVGEKWRIKLWVGVVFIAISLILFSLGFLKSRRRVSRK